eukprot:SAG25_NODE_11583_length_301_cov_0.500000_1_plen_100_part_11
MLRYSGEHFAALRSPYRSLPLNAAKTEPCIQPLVQTKRFTTQLLGGRERSSGPGTGFHQTLDERYIIKYINDEELDGFLTPSSKTRAPWLDYFEHMSQVL